MQRIHTLCIAAFLLGTTASACSWIPASFCATSNARPDDVVLSGKIVGVDMDGIDLEVIAILKGSESRDTIRIWDGTDFDCNGLFSMAAADMGDLDDTIIVVLPLIDAIENTWDVIGDYRRPVFLNFFTDFTGFVPNLRVVNGNVSGYIVGPASTPIWGMPYQEFMTNWNDGPDHCSTYLAVEGMDRTPPFLAQLAHTTLNLSIRSDAAPGSTVRIYTVNGQEVLAVKGAAGTMQVDLPDLSAGVYNIVLVQQDGTRSYARVVKW